MPRGGRDGPLTRVFPSARSSALDNLFGTCFLKRDAPACPREVSSHDFDSHASCAARLRRASDCTRCARRCPGAARQTGAAGVAGRLSRRHHVVDGLRRIGTAGRGQALSRFRRVELPCFPHRSCAVGRLFAVGFNSALVHVHGRRGHAVLDCQPASQGQFRTKNRRARCLSRRLLGAVGHFPDFQLEQADGVRLHERAGADWIGICVSLFAAGTRHGACN